MASADLDQNGTISLDEYLTVVLGAEWSIEFRKITQEQYKMFKSNFNEFDTNHNGVIDGDECTALVEKQLGRTPSPTEMEAFMAGASLKNPNCVTFEEYLNMVIGPGWKVDNKTISFKEFQVYQADFKAFDSNGNGHLDGDEIRCFLAKQIGRQPSEEVIQAFMGEVDLDADGTLTFDEYLNFMCGVGWAVAAQPQQPQTRPSRQQAPSSPTQEDPIEKIAKLKRLLDAGAITQGEFDSKKAQLLALV